MFSELHSKAAQATVARFHRNLSNLRKKKENGYNVGRLKRQAPAEFVPGIESTQRPTYLMEAHNGSMTAVNGNSTTSINARRNRPAIVFYRIRGK